MITPSVVHGLSAVPAIRRGEPGVRETEPVKPVPDEWITAAVAFMSPQVAALVRFQVLTGARPGEAVIIRGKDIDRSGRVGDAARSNLARFQAAWPGGIHGHGSLTMTASPPRPSGIGEVCRASPRPDVVGIPAVNTGRR